jgi:hypothetical protein
VLAIVCPKCLDERLRIEVTAIATDYPADEYSVILPPCVDGSLTYLFGERVHSLILCV